MTPLIEPSTFKVNVALTLAPAANVCPSLFQFTDIFPTASAGDRLEVVN